MVAAEPNRSGADPGPGVDKVGQTVVDPTKNVLDLVAAAIARQDDLRNMETAHLHSEIKLRAKHAMDMSKSETSRLDAIRSVDVAAVQQAAQVSATQAQTLAAQVATSAETLRTQVAAAATAATVALAAALEPIQKDIADLRRVQYEAVGGKAQTVETRDDRQEVRLNLGAVLGAVSVLLVLIFGTISVALTLSSR